MNLAKGTKFNIWQICILDMLFLAGVNLFNYYAYFLYAAVAIVLGSNARRLAIDRWFVVLMLFSTSFVIFYPSATDSVTTILKQYNYPLCYLIGLNLFECEKTVFPDKDDRRLIMAFCFPVFGTFAHYTLNLLTNFDSISRNTIDIWTNNVMSATGQACLAVTAMGVFIAWLFSDTTKAKKWVATIGIVLTIAYNFVLAGRTLIYMLLALLGLATIMKIKKINVVHVIMVFAVGLVVFLGLRLIYVKNWFGLSDWVLESNLAIRVDKMQFDQGARLENKLRYLRNLLDAPMGGGVLRKQYGYAHDLFLDTYSDSGFVAYFLLIAFVLHAVRSFFITVLGRSIGDECKLLIVCIYAVFSMIFFLEPILQSVPWVFCMFCFFVGLLEHLNQIKTWSYRSQ